MVDVLRSQQLIEEVDVALLPDIPKLAHDGLVILLSGDRHACPFRETLFGSFLCRPFGEHRARIGRRLQRRGSGASEVLLSHAARSWS